MPTTITFDAGTDGATVAAGSGVTSVTGTPTYSASGAKHGAMGMRTNGPTAATHLNHDLTLGVDPTTHSGSVYVRVNGMTTPTRYVQFRNLANASIASIRLHNDGHFQLCDAATAVKVASTSLWTASSYARLDWQYNDANTTAPVLTVRIFLAPEATAPADTISWTFSGTTSALERISVGVVGTAAAGQTRDIATDTVRLVDGLSWIGPFAPPAPVTGAWSFMENGVEVPLTLAGVMAGGVLVPTTLV